MLTPAATAQRPGRQRRTLALLSLAQVLSGVGSGAVVSVGSLVAVRLSGSRAWAGSVTTAMTLGAAVASLLLVRLAVAKGRRRALSVGLSVAASGAVGVVLAAATGTLWLLILSGLLLGFGSAATLQARFAATDLSSPQRRGRDLSLVVWMSTVGAVAGPSLVGVGDAFARVLGVPTVTGLFVLAALGMLLAAAVIWVGLRPDPYLVAVGRVSTVDISGSEGAGTAGGNDGAITPVGVRRGLRSLLSHPLAKAGLTATLASHAIMVAVMSVTAVHMTGHGASLTLVGVTVSLHIAGMYALAPVMGALADRVGGPIVVAGGLTTLAIAGLLAGLSGGAHAMTVVGLVLLGLGWSAATVAGSTMIVAGVPLADRVSAQGASDSLMSLAGAAGGVFAGLALTTVGFAGLGVAAAVVAVLTVGSVVGTMKPSISMERGMP